MTRNDLLNKDHLPPTFDNAALKKALTVLNVMNFADEEREAYEEHLKWLRIEANTLKKYETKGFEAGEAIGIEKGEAIKARKTLLKMFKMGIDRDVISQVTELTRAEVDQIIKEEAPEDK